jgi:hypothetical protein
MKKDCLRLVAAALGLIMVWSAMAGCGESRSPFAGTYRSANHLVDKEYIDLELQKDGSGTWTVAGKGIEFTWVVNSGKIWIYTKKGAIIILTPSQDGKTLLADTTGDWHAGCPPDSCVVFKRMPGGG